MKLQKIFDKYKVNPDTVVTVRIQNNSDGCRGFIAQAFLTPQTLRDKECIYFNTYTNVYTVRM